MQIIVRCNQSTCLLANLNQPDPQRTHPASILMATQYCGVAAATTRTTTTTTAAVPILYPCRGWAWNSSNFFRINYTFSLTYLATCQINCICRRSAWPLFAVCESPPMAENLIKADKLNKCAIDNKTIRMFLHVAGCSSASRTFIPCDAVNDS